MAAYQIQGIPPLWSTSFSATATPARLRSNSLLTSAAEIASRLPDPLDDFATSTSRRKRCKSARISDALWYRKLRSFSRAL